MEHPSDHACKPDFDQRQDHHHIAQGPIKVTAATCCDERFAVVETESFQAYRPMDRTINATISPVSNSVFSPMHQRFEERGRVVNLMEPLSSEPDYLPPVAIPHHTLTKIIRQNCLRQTQKSIFSKWTRKAWIFKFLSSMIGRGFNQGLFAWSVSKLT